MSRARRAAPVLAGLLAGLLAAAPAAGQLPPPSSSPPPGSEIYRRVGIDQDRLGAQIDLDLVFRDETGRPLALRALFGEKPVVLALVYYRCPSLCNQVLNGMLAAFKPLRFRVGREFGVVAVSFDPAETAELAAAKKRSYVEEYGPGAEEGWRFLTGDQAAITTLTRACGFRYFFDEKTGQFAHAAGIAVLTPGGRLSRYFYGVEYSARDLELGLVEASGNRIGGLAEQVLLLCYRYDPMTGKYGFAIFSTLRAGAILCVLSLAWFIVRSVRRERRSERRAAAPGAPLST